MDGLRLTTGVRNMKEYDEGSYMYDDITSHGKNNLCEEQYVTGSTYVRTCHSHER
jgi:hypothetical protein